MKRVVLFLLALIPFVSMAQYDEVYFVPKKEKKTVVIKSSEECYFVDAEEYVSNDASEYDEYAEGVYEEDTLTLNIDDLVSATERVSYTNDPDLYFDNDYSYSTRIVRFRSPGRLYSSTLRWDLVYGCGINDWLVYDNGYSIDIYPTVNNPLYHWGRYNYSLGFYRTWNLAAYKSTWLGLSNHFACFSPAWYDSPDWWYHYNISWGHNHYWYRAWNPPHKVYRDIPVNHNMYKRNGYVRRDGSNVVNNGRGDRGMRRGGTGSSRFVNKENKPGIAIGGASIRKEQDRRGRDGKVVSNDKKFRKGERGDGTGMRRQRPDRRMDLRDGNRTLRINDKKNNTDNNVGTSVKKYRQQPSRGNGLSLKAVNGKGNKNERKSVDRNQQRRGYSSSSDNGGNRRRVEGVSVREQRRGKENSYGNGSSRSYNRPSSTSVTRSRGGSESSFRSSGSSSRGSGSSFRSSGSSSRGSGSSFRSSGSGSSSRGGSRSSRR
ncbi:MAG: hypothetical protein IKJ49_03990 [Bacteroidaceae bacterium]|nr:hypothetical protein [Bacteroidaceae bacterium]